MDLKSITTLLSAHESTFASIIATASPSISGDALKSKLANHYINLILCVREHFALSDDSLEDPFENDSSFSSSKYNYNKPKKRRDPPIDGQMTAKPVEKGDPSEYKWQKSGAAKLFGGTGTRTSRGKRSGKGVATPVINLLNSDDEFEDDDSAGSVDEDEESMFVSSAKKGKKGKKDGGKRDRNGFTREEKERERNRGKKPGMGLGMAVGGGKSKFMVLIESTMSGALPVPAEHKRVVEVEDETDAELVGGKDGESRKEVVEIDDETVAGFVGGKDGEGGDREMEDAMKYADEDEEENIIVAENHDIIEVEEEDPEDAENEEESPAKRRRSA